MEREKICEIDIFSNIDFPMEYGFTSSTATSSDVEPINLESGLINPELNGVSY